MALNRAQGAFNNEGLDDMKKSDLIIKLSSELEVALSSAAEAIEKYEGDNLDDQTLEDAAYAARDFASEIDMSTDIDAVIGALQSIGE